MRILHRCFKDKSFTRPTLCKYFILFCDRSFYFLDGVFWSTRHLHFDEIQVVCFSVCCWYLRREPQSNLRSCRFSSMGSKRCALDLCSILGQVLDSVRAGYTSNLSPVNIQPQNQLLKMLFLLTWMVLTSWTKLWGFISGLSFLPYSSSFVSAVVVGQGLTL